MVPSRLAKRRQRRPDMPLSLVHLAFLYNEAGDHPQAAAAIRRALTLNPGAQDVAALAGAYLTEAGLAEEAVRRLAAYVTVPQPDVDVLIAYGVALASIGRSRERSVRHAGEHARFRPTACRSSMRHGPPHAGDRESARVRSPTRWPGSESCARGTTGLWGHRCRAQGLRCRRSTTGAAPRRSTLPISEHCSILVIS